MVKKTILTFIALLWLGGGLSFATAQELNYGEFLQLYFGVITHELSPSEQKPHLNYSNLKPSHPLYQLLQRAVADEKFPNLSIKLPLERPAFESDLSVLVKNNFGLEIPFTPGKVLSFDRLKTQMQSVYSQKKAEPLASDPLPDEAKKIAVAKTVFSLLKINFIHKEQLDSLSVPRYEELGTFVDQLGERYTRYYTPKEGKAFMDSLQSSFAGVGLYLSQAENGTPKVISVIENGPAQKVGLQPGDELLALDGIPFSSYKHFEDFSLALKGEVGSRVLIEVKRGSQTLKLEITRAKIQIPLMKSQKKGGVCYLRLYSFDLGSQKKFAEEMKSLGTCEMFVFDVRRNPGGVVDEVVGILDSFIPFGKPIVSINAPNKREILTSKHQFSFPVDKPIAILMDEMTASASEIFAGVLKTYYPEQVKLVGTQSYGKGSVQEVVELEEKSLLKYTTALRTIADETAVLESQGLTPDIFLQDDPSTPEDEVLMRLGV